jgi:two-component system chemotaxis sensor kinase CheA
METNNPAQTFLMEAEELLAKIEEIALEAQPGDINGENIHHLFRAFHTIKGSGAMFGFEAVAAFTHHVETVLDKVRDGLIPISAELIDLILASKDQIKTLLDAAQSNQPVPPENGQKLVARLNALLPVTAPAAGATGTTGAIQPPAPITPAEATPRVTAAAQTFNVQFRPQAGIMVSGTDPVMLLDELRSLGDCQIVAQTAGIPLLDQLKADQCYLAWDIKLTTDQGLNGIKDVFIFVEDVSEIKITPLTEKSPVQSPAPPPKEIPSAAVKEIHKPAAMDSVVRVPAERLDRLVSLVGELVMNQSRLGQVAAISNVPNLGSTVEELERLVNELRDNVLGIRMMPIGTTFGRFKRLVHDLSHDLGKEIDLFTEGADTEMDKTVLDRLGDPLVHIIRNSIDHGIEQPAERERLGKPRHGAIRLAASHVGSNVVITIDDDGHGVDLEAVRAKAVEKKLISAGASLTEKEVLDLLFLPGFSTAKAITSVSGRGVGMDVVKRQFDALRGQIAMTTTAGAGTHMTLTLPLTLAIINGLLVEIGADQFIVPMSVVTENVELHRSERARNNGRNVIPVRGDLIPYIRLRETFEITENEPDIEKIVIVRHGADRVGFVVDRVLGSHQTVIQSLGRFFQNLDLISGTTIMGDGRVALIMDVAGMVRFAERQILSKPFNSN